MSPLRPYPTITLDQLESTAVRVCAWGAGNSDVVHLVEPGEPLVLVEALDWPGDRFLQVPSYADGGCRSSASLPAEWLHPGQCEGWRLCAEHLAALLEAAMRPEQSLILRFGPHPDECPECGVLGGNSSCWYCHRAEILQED